jgi:hypothetical protein
MTSRKAEKLAAEAGQSYADDQLKSDHFQDWVWSQMVEAAKMEKNDPASVAFTMESLARNKPSAEKLAKNMLQQLWWDTQREVDRHTIDRTLHKAGITSWGGTETPDGRALGRTFFSAIEETLDSKDTRGWLAEEFIMPMANEILKEQWES